MGARFFNCDISYYSWVHSSACAFGSRSFKIPLIAFSSISLLPIAGRISCSMGIGGGGMGLPPRVENFPRIHGLKFRGESLSYLHPELEGDLHLPLLN